MQYVQLKNYFKDHTIFSLNDIRLMEPNFHRRRLNEWQDKGYIKKIITEFYKFADRCLFRRSRPIYDAVLFEIANRIYRPSYISIRCRVAA